MPTGFSNYFLSFDRPEIIVSKRNCASFSRDSFLVGKKILIEKRYFSSENQFKKKKKQKNVRRIVVEINAKIYGKFGRSLTRSVSATDFVARS